MPAPSPVARAFAALLALVACRSLDAPAAVTPAPPSPVARADGARADGARAGAEQAAAELAAAAIEEIRSGDYESARALLDRLLGAEWLAEARVRFAAGEPEIALVYVDRVLAVDPESAPGRALKASGSLALAEKAIAERGSPGLVEGALRDALAFYERGAPTAENALGASRAALLLGDAPHALELARRGVELSDDAGTTPAGGLVAERVWADAAFAAYLEARAADETERAAALAAETEQALERLLARTDEDPRDWQKLADLYAWEERWDDARATLDTALDRTPDDATLLERLARVGRSAGGADGAVEALEAHRSRHPESALGAWYAAVARFDAATERVGARFAAAADAAPTETLVEVPADGGDVQVDVTLDDVPDAPPDAAEPTETSALPEAFATAEAAFQRCRALDPTLRDACLGYEVMCRAGAGWALYQDGELEAAVAAFRSMNEVLERGIEWRIEGRLLSGIAGLQFVGARYNEHEDNESAAEVFQELSELQPEVADWANNAGFFWRDAAVLEEDAGRALCRAARGEGSEELFAELRDLAGVAAADAGTEGERERFRASAVERLGHARALMEKSAAAYDRAAELAPNDVRIVNDAALIHVHYLHTDLEASEALLRRSVALGEEQLADADALDERARWELENAWGDAHENLGVLFALRGERDEAIRWFERAVEIGPERRPMPSNAWLPFLRGERGPEEPSWFRALADWGRPCE